MILAIPKEILPGEKRVAALPETVKKYVARGWTVRVETGAAEGIYIKDADYEAAGATIVKDVAALLGQADVILKVKQPYRNDKTGKHEVDMMRDGCTLVTFLHPAAPGNHDLVRKLRDKNITSFTMDGIPRISRAQRMDALTSMSTITGYRAVIMCASELQKFIPMVGTAIGATKPAVFLVIGAGVVGLQAIATAKRLGAIVKVVDIRDEARKAGMSLGAKVAGFEVPPELALGEGGYAKALPPEWVEKERALLRPLVQEADAVILSALVPSEVAPVLVTEDMVKQMKAGSIIVDVSIDQGGNCAVSEVGAMARKHGVAVSGVANIPGSMALDASWLYANNIYYYMENLFKKGPGPMDLDDEIAKHSMVTREGKIVHAGALKAMGNRQA